MSHQKPLLPAIAPANGGALINPIGPQRIATRMAENLLSVARSQERALAAQRHHPLGDNKPKNLKLNQFDDGLDKEMLEWGVTLTGFHLEAGVRKFADLAAVLANELGVSQSRLKPYLRCWYNGARDVMEDHGLSIEGMDSPDVVLAELQKILKQELLSTLTRVMDAAFRLGHYQFREAGRFVMQMIREDISDDVADQITLDLLQGAYIAMAGRYKKDGASSNFEVIEVKSLDELDQRVGPTTTEQNLGSTRSR
ncbi:MAG: hypothetical protein PHX60_10670 [Giesbergeria sp.]|uniref:hypothetical protein n=1 Tax=Giesbergeria sp. TaxID=2818473 RepID=UPI002618E160|nr:hypothetical protein [Giesbergeria sp.]MDD2610137.1 hypothetical protein [Giesbergeria sp.]